MYGGVEVELPVLCFAGKLPLFEWMKNDFLSCAKRKGRFEFRDVTPNESCTTVEVNNLLPVLVLCKVKCYSPSKLKLGYYSKNSPPLSTLTENLYQFLRTFVPPRKSAKIYSGLSPTKIQIEAMHLENETGRRCSLIV